MNLKKYIKTPEQIEKMRIAGRGAASVLAYLAPFVKKGVTTLKLNTLAHQYITETLDAIPAPLNYRGFPKSICTSINHVVCHGIPNEKPLKDGDIINIDVTIIKDGFHGDTSMMFYVGNTSTHAKKLCTIAQECLYLGIDLVKPGISINTLGRAIGHHASKNFCSSVRDYCGHGIGLEFHEPGFQILHYDAPEQESLILHPGLTFTIEPMINAGKSETRLLADNWTVVTKDRSLSAQWEHTLLVTDVGVEVLTKRPEESFS